MRLGIFGGTFNPIHYGHLMLAECAREQFRLDEIWFMPTATPPHKIGRELPGGRVRLAMVKLAVRSHPNLCGCDLELRRGGVSYTLDTIQAVHREHPRARLFFIMGSDMLRVPWRGLPTLRRLCTFLAAERPDGAAKRWPGVRTINMPTLAISSSEIRARVRRGESIRYWVPDAVAAYIHRHRLYR